MNKTELTKILKAHKEWLVGEGGQRANLQRANLQGADLQGANLQGANLWGANLQGANLWGADLQGANLQGANLRGADLQSADLQGADLRGANLQRANLRGASLWGADLQRADLQGANLWGADLQGADLKNTILEGINWLAYIGIVPDKKGNAYAYKIVNSDGEGIFNGGINYLKGTTFKAEVDPDIKSQCSHGINLATFGWCINQFTDKSHRLLIFKFNVKDAVCPIGSDGKFRVSKCEKVGECDWKGNLEQIRSSHNKHSAK